MNAYSCFALIVVSMFFSIGAAEVSGDWLAVRTLEIQSQPCEITGIDRIIEIDAEIKSLRAIMKEMEGD